MSNYNMESEFVQFIKSVFPRAQVVSGGSEIVTRCMYCEDSKDPNHVGHMYIKIPKNDNDTILFHCFKCQTSGILNSRTLLDWGIYEPRMAVELDKVYKSSLVHSSKYGNIVHDGYRYPYVHNEIFNRDLAAIKLQYINNRIGANLTFDDCKREKIILNLGEYISQNGASYTRHQNIVQQLNDCFVGFLSLDNNFVNLRKICSDGLVYESIDKRYINYNIHGKNDNTEKMYVLPATLDLTLPIKIPIHIAEGPFDILSIKYNLRKKDNDYGIFAAATGSGYKGLLRYIISTFQIYYFDLHIYPDNDKYGNSKMVDELVHISRPFGSNVYEHRNICPGEKDFGVPPDRIVEKIYLH